MKEYLDKLSLLGAEYSTRIIGGLLILVLGFWLARKFTHLFSKFLAQTQIDSTLCTFAANVVRVILYGLVLLASLSSIGVPMTSVVALLGTAGIGFWLAWRARPEWVVTQPGQQALFAPLDSATPHFALPPGSVVRLRESAGDWLRIRAGRDEGWVRRSAAQPVLPWQDSGLR